MNVSSCVIGRTNSRPRAVLELEELGDPVAAGRLPELGRREHRHEHLLRADRVHLLADDLLDLPCTRQPSGRNVQSPALTCRMIAAAHEQLVADRLGVGRLVAQGREEELRWRLTMTSAAATDEA